MMNRILSLIFTFLSFYLVAQDKYILVQDLSSDGDGIVTKIDLLPHESFADFSIDTSQYWVYTGERGIGSSRVWFVENGTSIFFKQLKVISPYYDLDSSRLNLFNLDIVYYGSAGLMSKVINEVENEKDIFFIQFNRGNRDSLDKRLKYQVQFECHYNDYFIPDSLGYFESSDFSYQKYAEPFVDSFFTHCSNCNPENVIIDIMINEYANVVIYLERPEFNFSCLDNLNVSIFVDPIFTEIGSSVVRLSPLEKRD